jgi:hypothetical protein
MSGDGDEGWRLASDKLLEIVHRTDLISNNSQPEQRFGSEAPGSC